MAASPRFALLPFAQRVEPDTPFDSAQGRLCPLLLTLLLFLVLKLKLFFGSEVEVA